NPPIQIWACGVTEHRHLAKADALRCQDENAEMRTGAETAIFATASGDRNEPRGETGDMAPPVDPACRLAENSGHPPAIGEDVRAPDATDWPDEVQGALPAPSLTSAMRDVGRIAGIVDDLEWLRDHAAEPAAITNDPLQTAWFRATVDHLCERLSI